MKYARIIDNRVQETFVPHSTSTDIADYFTAEVAAQFVLVDNTAEVGMIKNEDGTFTIPAIITPTEPQ